MTDSQINALFIAATLAPIGSLARVELAETWIMGAMFRIDDAAVAVALTHLRGWSTFGKGCQAARNRLARLIAECEGYLAAAAELA